MLVEELSEGVAQGSPTVQVANIRRYLHEKGCPVTSRAMGKSQGLHMTGQAHWVCTTKPLASQVLKRMIPFRSME